VLHFGNASEDLNTAKANYDNNAGFHLGMSSKTLFCNVETGTVENVSCDMCFAIRKADEHSDNSRSFHKDLKVGLLLPHAFHCNNSVLIPPWGT